MNCIRNVLNRDFIVDYKTGEETKEGGTMKNGSSGAPPSFSCHASCSKVRESFGLP